MTERCNSNNCEMEQKMLKKAIEVHVAKIRYLDSSCLNADCQWDKSDFRPVINSLYQVLKTYNNCDMVEKLVQRVKSFRRRMFFMSAMATEKEAHLLAYELEAFLES